MNKLIMLAALCAAITASAHADEVWSSEAGEIVYLADEGVHAILRQNHPISGPRHLYIRGLAGNYDNRSNQTFYGFWIDADRSGRTTQYDRCGMTLTGPDGVQSDHFGNIQIEFDSAGFPSGFTAAVGMCSVPAMENIWRAEPVTGFVQAECEGDSIFPMSGEFVFPVDQNFYSPCGGHYLRFQSDGNLVIYTREGRPIWALNSLADYRRNARAIFQSDGNLATYDRRGRYVWSARDVPSPSGSQLVLTEQGELHIVGPDGAVLWNSGRQSR